METTGGRQAPQSTDILDFLEAVFQHTGYDFRDYSPASIQRRILGRIEAEGSGSLPNLLAKALDDPACMGRLLSALTVNVTSMFRDPDFYLAFRRDVVTLLKTYPFVRIWHAGCSSGEEVYSLAILLKEEGILERCLTYATDISDTALQTAKEGTVPLVTMKEYTENYQGAGGTASFSDYYTACYDRAIFRPYLRRNAVFARHNLVTDGSFNEFNVILCRNVMIYFN